MNRRKEGEEEGGSRERFEEGGKGRMALVVCKLIAYLCGYCLATTHNMHMQCTCCCLPPQQSLRSGAAHTGHCCLCATSCSMGCLPIAIQWPVAPALRTAPSSG